MTRSRARGALAAVLLLPMLAVVPTALAANAAPADPGDAPPSDTRELTRSDFTLDGQPVEVPSTYQGSAQARSFSALAAAPTPPVGTVRQWLGLDDFNGVIYRKNYTLRGVGEHVEVWVANDIAFPAGDCRLQIPSSTVITDEQVAYFVNEFDTNMYPKESEAFSVPPDRDGSNALISGDFTGDGDKIVTLIDNVRDDNFYDFPASPTYIAGFFFATFNELSRPQHHDDRRLRLAAPHRREPAERADQRPVHQPIGASVPLRGRVRTRVPAPAAVLHGPVRDHLAQRGSVRLRADSDRLRRCHQDRLRARGGQPHLLLPGLRHSRGRGQHQSARLRRAGELAQPVGRGQPQRTPCGLRARLLVHAVPVRPLWHGVHVGPAPGR